MSGRSPWPFVVLWRLALRESKLSATQRLLGHTLATYMRPQGWTGPNHWQSPGREAIARGANVQLRTVDLNLPALADAGLLRILSERYRAKDGAERSNRRHVYVALIPEELGRALLERPTGIVDGDLAACEQVGAALAGPGANEVLSAQRTSFAPLANVVRSGSESGSLEVDSSSREFEIAAAADLERPDPDEVARVRRALHEAGLLDEGRQAS